MNEYRKLMESIDSIDAEPVEEGVFGDVKRKIQGKVSPLEQAARLGIAGITELISILEVMIDSGQIDGRDAEYIRKTIAQTKGWRKIIADIKKTGTY